MKSARTQAEKRKRGEYNRVVAVKGKGVASAVAADENGVGDGVLAAKKGGKEDRPGAGKSVGWLAGRDGARDLNGVRTEEQAGGAARDQTNVVALAAARTDNSTRDQTGNVASEQNGGGVNFSTTTATTAPADTTDAGPARKRMKREKKRKVRKGKGTSDSDYEASSDEDEDTKDF